MKNHPVPSVLARKILALIMVLTLFTMAAHAASPTPPDKMTYQGFLVDANGAALAPNSPANYPVIFRIYDASQGGTLLWSEQQIVTIDKGTFSVVLGEGTQYQSESRDALSSVFNGAAASDRFLGISVTIGATTSEIAPRLRLLPAPYAFLAKSANALVGADGSPLLTTAAGGVLNAGGSISISGTINTTGNLSAGGNVSASGNITATGLNVTGTAIVTGLSVTGPATAAGLNVTGTVTAGTLNVTGAAAAGSLNVAGTNTANTFVGFGIIPIGGIIMWSGQVNAIPTGWALCDGAIHDGRQTPNLCDRFVIGAGNAYPVNTPGGSPTKTLAVANLPAHTHGYTDSDFSGYSQWWGSAIFNGNAWTGNSGSHNLTTASTGNGSAFDIMPPYFALAYIMRTK